MCYSLRWYLQNNNKNGRKNINYGTQQSEFDRHSYYLSNILPLLIVLFLLLLLVYGIMYTAAKPAEFTIVSYEPESIIHNQGMKRIISQLNVRTIVSNQEYACAIPTKKRYFNIQEMEHNFIKNKTLNGYVFSNQCKGDCCVLGSINEYLTDPLFTILLWILVVFFTIICEIIAEILFINYYILPVLANKQQEHQRMVEEIENRSLLI